VKLTVMVFARLEEKDTTPPARVHDRAGKPPPVASSVPGSLGAVAEPDVPSELTVLVVQEEPSDSPQCRSWPTMSNGEDGWPIPSPKPGIQLQSDCHCHCQGAGPSDSDSPGICATSSNPKPTALNVSSGKVAVPWTAFTSFPVGRGAPSRLTAYCRITGPL